MPRLKLDHKKEYIQLVIDPEDKAALEAWWAANDTSMSVIARRLLQSAATVHSNGDESQHLERLQPLLKQIIQEIEQIPEPLRRF